MALYAIGDLHLSLSSNKPMDVFGPAWANHVERLKDAFAELKDDDVTVLCGDLSWGSSLEESLQDFRFIDALPGRKIVLKGNHDYWWNTKRKMDAWLENENLDTISILHNNAFKVGDYVICGTRGWFFEENRSGEHDEKVFKRELGRLETSLKAAGEKNKLVFLHYPPRYKGYECREILELLEKYEVRRCFYGHLHGASHGLAMEGQWDGIEYRLVSADKLGFRPFMVIS